jgi:hypothetical protein
MLRGTLVFWIVKYGKIHNFEEAISCQQSAQKGQQRKCMRFRRDYMNTLFAYDLFKWIVTVDI